MMPPVTASPTEEIWAIVILYRPEIAAVRDQFAAVSSQVAGVIYYDNGGGHAVLSQLGLLSQPGVRCLGDGQNCGIAEALNRGLELASSVRASFALLLDQDSVPSAEMVERLATSYQRAAASGGKVAAVGPAIFDVLHGRLEPFGHAIAFSDRRFRPGSGMENELVHLYYLITSGTLIRLAALGEIGPMEASLFIDSVDFEWSFRARSKGYSLLGSYATCLLHRRGERLHRAWPGVPIRLHSAQRLFYIYRNHLRLCFRRYVPAIWKIRGLGYLLLRATLFAVFVPHRGTNLHAILRGTLQGLRQGFADWRQRGV
jgi:rhamnosyltransferase